MSGNRFINPISETVNEFDPSRNRPPLATGKSNDPSPYCVGHEETPEFSWIKTEDHRACENLCSGVQVYLPVNPSRTARRYASAQQRPWRRCMRDVDLCLSGDGNGHILGQASCGHVQSPVPPKRCSLVIERQGKRLDEGKPNPC